MNIYVLRIFLYEWIRTGGIRKIVQLTISLIIPIILFMLVSVLPAILKQNSETPTNMGAFIIFIVSAMYAIYYIIESDSIIMNGFPSDYLPIKKSDFYLVFLIFTFIMSVIVIYTSIFLTILIVNRIQLNGLNILSFKNIIKYIFPLLIGIPYMVLNGILFGSLIGIIGKKISDNFSQNTRIYILKIYSLIVFLSVFKYFKNIYQLIIHNQLNSNLWQLSPIYFSSIVSQFFIGNTHFYSIIYSIILAFLLFVLFIFVSNIKIVIPLKNNISIDIEKRNIAMISPLWNLVLKRFFSLFTIVFLMIWFIGIFINKFYLNNLFFQSVNNVMMILYVFIIMDKMFTKEKEDYRHIWESVPIRKNHITGVFFGFYYILFSLPIYIYYKLSISGISFSTNIDTPNTLSGFLLQHFSIITFTAVIPFLIFLYPYIWASNSNGKKLLKKNAIFNFIFFYFLLSGIIGLSYAYIGSESFRVFIDRQIFGYGYYVLKYLFYLIFIFACGIHIRALQMLFNSVLTKK